MDKPGNFLFFRTGLGTLSFFLFFLLPPSTTHPPTPRTAPALGCVAVTTGNVVKFGVEPEEVNTGGLGAVLGLFHCIGYGDVGNLALNENVRRASNAAADAFGVLKIPKTLSQNAPSWWRQG